MVVEIRTSQDLLDLLDNNEEFRRAAQRALLTDGLLELPDIVREMQQTQLLMIQRIDRMDLQIQEMQQTQKLMIQQIAQVAERMDRMEERQGRMEERQDRMEDLLARVVAQQELTKERIDRMDARFEQVAAEMASMNKRIGDLDGRVDSIDRRVGDIDGRVDSIDKRVGDIDGRVDSIDRRVGDMDGRLRGWELERESVRKLLPRLAREYDVRRIRAVSADSHRSAIRVNDVWEARFEEAVGEAFDAGRITAAEDGLLDRTDIVARGLRIDDGADMWFVVQASVTIDDGDIERAAAGAVALRKVSGDDAAAVVYGRRIAAQQRDRAGELGVAVMLDEEGEQARAAAISTSPSPGAPTDDWRSLSGFQPHRGTPSPKQVMFPDNSSVAITDWRQLLVEVVRWLTDNNHLTKEHCPIHIPKAKARYIVAEQPTRPSGERHPRMVEVNSLWVVADMRYDHVVGNTRIVIGHVGMDASQFKLRW